MVRANVTSIDSVTIFHNARCSKSRAALAVVEGSGREVIMRRYLDDPPSPKMLRWIVDHLDGSVADLVRRDGPWSDLAIDPGELSDPERVVEVLTDHIELLERPLVILGDVVVIGRPTERVGELLSS